MSDPIIYAGGYLPVGLWLSSTTCLVYTDESPEPAVVADLVRQLSDQGLQAIEVGDDLKAAVLSLTMSRVQDIAGHWAVWSQDEATARADITAAVTAEL